MAYQAVEEGRYVGSVVAISAAVCGAIAALYVVSFDENIPINSCLRRQLAEQA